MKWVLENNKWISYKEKLDVNNFNLNKEEFSSYRFYQSISSGTFYNRVEKSTKDENIINIDNIYGLNEFKIKYSPVYNPSVFTYSRTIYNLPTNTKMVNSLSDMNLLLNDINEYNYTTKGYFTPDRLIKNDNDVIYVDLITDSTIEDFDVNNEYVDITIDSVRVKDDYIVLIKGIRNIVAVSNSDNVNDIIETDYEFIRNNGTDSLYYVPSILNGLYRYKNNKFSKLEDSNTTYCAKNGVVNVGKFFSRKRLRNGRFPSNMQGNDYFENNNIIVRSKIEYENLYELKYNSSITHGEQSIIVSEIVGDNTEKITYSIPSRILICGDFGKIYLIQNNTTSIIETYTNENLNHITQTSDYYWVVGDMGILLKIHKTNFIVEKIDLGIKSNLNHISFIYNNKGVVCGDDNTIFITKDSKNWERVLVEEFNSYNYLCSYYRNYHEINIGGDNGVFITIKENNNKFEIHKERISKLLGSLYDEYVLVGDITCINYYNDILYLGSDDGKIFTRIDNKGFISLDLSGNYEHSVAIKSITFHNDVLYFSQNNGVYEILLDGIDYNNIDVNNNYIGVNVSNLLLQEDIEYIDILDDNLIIIGDNTLSKLYNLISNTEEDIIDSSFYDSIKPKMLFLNYDIASKVYFHKKDGEYRLPTTQNIEFDNKIEFFSDRPTWIDYMTDDKKVHKYLDGEIVYTNLKFRKSVKSNTYNISNIYTEFTDVFNVFPNILNSDSIYRGDINDVDINGLYNGLYLYNQLGALVINSNLYGLAEIGDELYLESDLLSGDFMINNIVNDSVNNISILYFYTNFDNTIINSIKDINVNIINLNIYNDWLSFVDNFKKSCLSISYDINHISDLEFEFKSKYSTSNAYYNLEIVIETDINTYDIRYEDTYSSFGYTPNYNINDYLSNIDSTRFTSDKEYHLMPIYDNIPCSIGDDINNEIFIDNGVNESSMIIGSNLKYIYDSLLPYVFYNIELNTSNGIKQTNRVLLIDKKSENGKFILFFSDKFNFHPQLDDILSVSIISRRTLSQISEDLRYLNNIQRQTDNVNVYDDLGSNIVYNYETFRNRLKTKYPTDSYCKALLSDLDTSSILSNIIYTDYNNDLAIQICNNPNVENLDIANISINPLTNKYVFNFSEMHDINNNNIIISLNSSDTAYDYPEIIGFRNIKVLNKYSVEIDVIESGIKYGIPFNIKKINKDHFLYVKPLDLFEVGVNDNNIKQSVEILDNNISNFINVKNVDLRRYRFRMVDGLDLSKLSEYNWILEAEISNAIIGLKDNKIIWYKGEWYGGRWFDGIWISGTWYRGDWYNGTWYSNGIDNRILTVEVDMNNYNNTYSIWKDGRWFDGTWNNGTWKMGRLYNCTWNNGIWLNGIWNDGTWNNGIFSGGIWVNGTWNNGIFNCDNGYSTWYDGYWYGGDFECGIWYNGLFESKNNISRFGTKASNSRNALWHNGVFTNSEFHSNLNSENGVNKVSLVHKYSFFNSGIFSGKFYGGIAKNINFRNSIWYGGILEDIKLDRIETVSGVDGTYSYLVVKGEWYFTNGLELVLMDNMIDNQFSNLGSTKEPKYYRVSNSQYNKNTNETFIYLSVNLYDINNNSGVTDYMRIVSKFDNSNWMSGLWYNGYMNKGRFHGGKFYMGHIDGIFG